MGFQILMGIDQKVVGQKQKAALGQCGRRGGGDPVKAVNDPATRERLRESALDPIGSSAEDLGRIVRESHERMGALIRKIGLQPQ